MISAWFKSRSQRLIGKSGSTPAMMAMRCALKVRIMRSAMLRRCMSGGTLWCLHFHLLVMLEMKS